MAGIVTVTMWSQTVADSQHIPAKQWRQYGKAASHAKSNNMAKAVWRNNGQRNGGMLSGAQNCSLCWLPAWRHRRISNALKMASRRDPSVSGALCYRLAATIAGIPAAWIEPWPGWRRSWRKAGDKQLAKSNDKRIVRMTG